MDSIYGEIEVRDKRPNAGVEKKYIIKDTITESFNVQFHAEIRRVTHVKELYFIKGKDVVSEFLEIICSDDNFNYVTIRCKDVNRVLKKGMIGTINLQVYVEHKYYYSVHRFFDKIKFNLLDFMEDENTENE